MAGPTNIFDPLGDPLRDFTPAQRRRLTRMRRLVRVLDTSMRIPGTPVRFGLDSLIGLLPGIGDVGSALVSLYLLNEGARLGVSRKTLVRMGANVVADTLLGSIPIAGDLFDVAWKSNLRNLKLVEAELGRRAAEQPSGQLALDRTERSLPEATS